jgi:microcystin-dependent protein
MANYEATKYDFDGANLTGIEGIPTATIVPWSSASVPSGFLECDGTAVSRTTYATLFGIVGTTYGAGDGSTTFNVPNLADNVPVGKSPAKALASTGGANTVAATGNVGGSTANATLSSPQLASHSHSVNGTGPAASPPAVTISDTGPFRTQSRAYNSSGLTSNNTGSGDGHSHNMSATFSGDSTSVVQPYLTVIYIIKT